MCRYKGGRYKRSKIKNPQSIESQWIADWSECRDSNSGPLEPHSLRPYTTPQYIVPHDTIKNPVFSRLSRLSAFRLPKNPRAAKDSGNADFLEKC